MTDKHVGPTEFIQTRLLLLGLPVCPIRLEYKHDDVVPKNRFPSLDDKPNLPYTEAVILEVMRRHTLGPLYAPHATLRDAEVFECFIPKGCMVITEKFIH